MGVWIEIAEAAQYAIDNMVTPLVGVWIEMSELKIDENKVTSLPLWECGLKWLYQAYVVPLLPSLPLWECGLKFKHPPWICNPLWSLPLWECGLKSLIAPSSKLTFLVTPLVGVWIEISIKSSLLLNLASLPLWECGLKYLCQESK